jgi:NADP-dependent 3-hydroxy acid dehydrogenase YdfG
MDRVAVVTGASAGIGRATALALAREGIAVVVGARRAQRLEELVRVITDAGGRATAVPGDVTSDTDVQALIDAAILRYGRLDIVVCNAGAGLCGSADAISTAEMTRLMDVNYHGTYRVVHAALPVFRRQAAGHIVVVSSIVGRRGVPDMSTYCATKFAQVGLAESLRAELYGSGIHTTVVYPVATDTEFRDVMARASRVATRGAGPMQSADVVARAIVRAVLRPVAEVYPFRLAKGLTVLTAVAPRLVDFVMKRWTRTPVPPPRPGDTGP